MDSLGVEEADNDQVSDMGDDVPLYDDPTPTPARGRGRGTTKPAAESLAPTRGRGTAKPAAEPEKTPVTTRKSAKPKPAPVEEDLPEYEEDLANAIDDLDADLADTDDLDDMDMPADDLMDSGPEDDSLEDEAPPTPTRKAVAPTAGGVRRESLRPTGRTRS